MPSFFRALARILQGKPVFEASDNPLDSHDAAQAPVVPPAGGPPPEALPKSTIRKGNPHTFPVVYVRRVMTRTDAKNMQVYCYIHNYFSGEVMLDKIKLLGTVKEIDSFLRPGEEREFLVYKGPKIAKPQHYEALLHYRTQDGDYFEAMHDVKFAYQSDKTYILEAMHLHTPIRDIYG